MDKASFLKFLDDPEISAKVKAILGTTSKVTGVKAVVEMSHQCEWLIKKVAGTERCSKPGETEVGGKYYCGIKDGKDGKATGHTKLILNRLVKDTAKSDTRSVVSSTGEVSSKKPVSSEISIAVTADPPKKPARSGAGGPATDDEGETKILKTTKAEKPKISIGLIPSKTLKFERLPGSELYISTGSEKQYLLDPRTRTAVGVFNGVGKPFGVLDDKDKRLMEANSINIASEDDKGEIEDKEDKHSDYGESIDGGEE